MFAETLLNTPRIFITGTDTHVGKTYVATHLLKAHAKAGLRAVGIKPIASGCHWQAGQLVNEDALALQAHATCPLPYERVNPLAFELAVAPHIAAAPQTLSVSNLLTACQGSLAVECDRQVIEGAGGWLCPLNATETLADFAVSLDCPVLLVVGLQLGCLNHAALTYQAIQASGAPWLGWVANRLPPGMPHTEDNIEMLSELLNAAPLALL